jgi:hypothetical protein
MIISGLLETFALLPAIDQTQAIMKLIRELKLRPGPTRRADQILTNGHSSSMGLDQGKEWDS